MTEDTTAYEEIEGVRGDGPCVDCGTDDNPMWFAPSPFWNEVMGPDDRYAIVCPYCFAKRVYRAGFRPHGFEIRPDWPWAEASDAHQAVPGSSGRPAGARVEGEVGDTTPAGATAPSTAPEPAPEVEETAGGSISPIAPPETTTEVDRVEVIGNTGRLLVKRPVSDVVLSLQDSGRTLKVFLTEPEETAEAVCAECGGRGFVVEGHPTSAQWPEPCPSCAARPSSLREDTPASAPSAVNTGFCPSCLKPEDYCICVVNKSAGARQDTLASETAAAESDPVIDRSASWLDGYHEGKRQAEEARQDAPASPEEWERVDEGQQFDVRYAVWMHPTRNKTFTVPLAVEQAISRAAEERAEVEIRARTRTLRMALEGARISDDQLQARVQELEAALREAQGQMLGLSSTLHYDENVATQLQAWAEEMPVEVPPFWRDYLTGVRARRVIAGRQAEPEAAAVPDPTPATPAEEPLARAERAEAERDRLREALEARINQYRRYVAEFTASAAQGEPDERWVIRLRTKAGAYEWVAEHLTAAIAGESTGAGEGE